MVGTRRNGARGNGTAAGRGNGNVDNFPQQENLLELANANGGGANPEGIPIYGVPLVGLNLHPGQENQVPQPGQDPNNINLEAANIQPNLGIQPNVLQ